MTLLLLITSALAGPAVPTDAVESFILAGDSQDVPALEAVLHKDFRVVAQMPDGVSVMPRSQYISLIRGGKIGGVPRTTVFDVVMHSGDLATVKGRLDSSAAHFDCTWTLARGDRGWQVIQDAVAFSPKS
ncbi:MAG: nuclear transport factor 2 family protein [Myxococcota bacterium]